LDVRNWRLLDGFKVTRETDHVAWRGHSMDENLVQGFKGC
jgi:hypothetical protein